MARMELPQGWFWVPLSKPQQPVAEWLLQRIPEGFAAPIYAKTRIAIPRDVTYLTEIVQILELDYRSEYESDPQSLPARPLTAETIASNIRSGARGRWLTYEEQKATGRHYEYEIELPESDVKTRRERKARTITATDDVRGQIELALDKALAEIEPQLREELIAAYRGQTDQRFAYLMREACKPHAPDPKGGRWDKSYMRISSPEKSGWHPHEVLSYDREAAKEIFTEPYYVGDEQPEYLWSTMCQHPELYSANYEHADREAEDHVQNAHRSFVFKNLSKLLYVIGDRKDFEEIAIQVSYRGDVFVGTIDLRLSNAEIHADLGLKYVLRTDPRLTPYWQYPLTFSRVVVDGREVKAASFGIIPEDDVKKAITGKGRPTEAEAAAAAGLCPGSGQNLWELLKGNPNRDAIYREAMGWYSKRGECPLCGQVVSLSSAGNLRKHKA